MRINLTGSLAGLFLASTWIWWLPAQSPAAENANPAESSAQTAAKEPVDVMTIDAAKKALDSYRAAISAAQDKYKAVLKVALDEATKKGDLDASKQVKAEIDRLADEKVTSSDADFASPRAKAGQATFTKATEAAANACRLALEAAMKSEVRAGRLEAAEAIRTYIDALLRVGGSPKPKPFKAQVRIVPEESLPKTLQPGEKPTRPSAVSASSHGSPSLKPEFSIDNDPNSMWQLARYAFPGNITFSFDKPARARHFVIVQRPFTKKDNDVVQVGKVVINNSLTLDFKNFEAGQVMVIDFTPEASISSIQIQLLEGNWRPGIRDAYGVE
jgi:hypothetical protein